MKLRLLFRSSVECSNNTSRACSVGSRPLNQFKSAINILLEFYKQAIGRDSSLPWFQQMRLYVGRFGSWSQSDAEL